MGDWNLEIRKVELDDDATYECQHLKSRSRAAKLTVFVPPDNPYVIGGPRIDVIENLNVTLTCVSEGGKPAATIKWYDENGDLISDTDYRTEPMVSNSKLFVSKSSISLVPSKRMHNATYKCEAGNHVGANRPAFVRFQVKFAPSVTVVPVRRGMPLQGEKAGFQCLAEANPPPYAEKYRWYFDDNLIEGQYGYYYEIQNVTKSYHNHQIKCSVQNELGTASGIRTIEVQYPPVFIYVPSNAAGNEMDLVTLRCAADSNPAANYFWTKGTSNERISVDQNLSIRVQSHTVGDYYCHAQIPEFPAITSRAAEVLMNGPPRILSPDTQYAITGEDAHLNCASSSVPKPTRVEWSFHDAVLDETNHHYRIINSPMLKGYRSTLIIIRSLTTDFGLYTCRVTNDLGTSELEIALEVERPFPLMVAMISAFTFVILILVTTIFGILCRRRFRQNSKQLKGHTNNVSNAHTGTNTQMATAMNNMIKNNNLDRLSDTSNLKPDLETPSFSNDADSAWEGSDNQDGIIYGRAGGTLGVSSSQLLREMDPDFPPKPDVVSNGYVPYGNYVREFNPPFNRQGSPPIYGSTTIVTPVSPILPRGEFAGGGAPSQHVMSTLHNNNRSSLNSGQTCQYSTFLPAVAPPVVRTSSNESSNSSSHSFNPNNYAASATPSSHPMLPASSASSSSNNIYIHPCSSPPTSSMYVATAGGDGRTLPNGHPNPSGIYGTVSVHRPIVTSTSGQIGYQGEVCMSTPSPSLHNMSCLREEVEHSPPMDEADSPSGLHIMNPIRPLNGMRSNTPKPSNTSLLVSSASPSLSTSTLATRV
eukprot:TCALIF_12216-PA protein Name:"Similar to rst Irregular chiasm C-roughest protein (Drosophila melanogaster)" AED:0.01 eAED:0.01 QI:0/0.81/0.83/0.91/0.90/0.83/12/682/815